MISPSLRWRLPLTYAGLALLTAVLLNTLLLVTLELYYQRLEQTYLMNIGLTSSVDLARLLAAEADAATLTARTQQLAEQYGVRMRLADANSAIVVDTGTPAASGLEGPLFLEVAYGFGRFRRTQEDAEITLQTPESRTPLGTLRVSEGPAYGRDIVTSVAQVGLAAGLAAVGVAGAAGVWVSRRMVKPLLALTATSTRLAQGDLSARATVERADEIGTLAASFNRMAGQVEGTVETLRRFIADAAHELHTPLTALATDLDLAASEPDPAQARAFVRRARAQTERLAALSSDLLDLSRLEAGTRHAPADVDLKALVAELAETYASRAEQAGLAFELELDALSAHVSGHAGQARQAVGNLLDNALKFTPEGGSVTLKLTTDTDGTRVSVLDTGIGIPTQDLPGLFARFHRGRNAAGYAGSGLGLAIVQAIMAQQGGRVEAQSRPGGTVMMLWWPSM